MPASRRTIVILGPREDAVLEHFHRYCSAHSLACHRVSDPRDMPFILTFGRQRGVGARLAMNGEEYLLADVALFIRGMGHMMHSTLDNPFSQGEYFSALWALASQAPHIINRPGRWAWESRIAQERYFGEASLLPRSTSHSTSYFSQRLATLGPGYHQADVSNVTEHKTFSFNRAEEQAFHQSGHVLSGRFTGQPRYLIELFSGACAKVVLDETGLGFPVPSYLDLRERILAFASDHSLQHFAVVTLFVDGHPRLAKLDIEPPPRWYEEYGTDLFQGMVQVLLGHTESEVP